ncbi:MAG: DNA modification methylase [Candidatus Bathyarchaeota archaeon]|nr:DNA modification methylase [Candidatus Bathyarchaeota archaeon]
MTTRTRLIPIGSIKVGHRYRSVLGDLTGLKSSIERVGLLNPICVDTDLNIITGRRRLEAYRQLGWEVVECTILQLDSLESKLAELHENTERENLTWQDEVKEKAEIDRLFRDVYGSAKERQRTDLLTGSDSDPVPWSYKRTADLLKESKALIIADIQLADALEQHPKLEEFKYKSQAKSRLREIRREEERNALLSEAKSLDYRVYHDDSMSMIEDGSIDLIVTDPPMFLPRSEEIELTGRTPMKRDVGSWDVVENPLEEFGRWAADFYRVLKEGGSLYVFISDRFISSFRDILERAGFSIRTLITWHKTNPRPQVRKYTYCMSTEHILFATKGSGHTFNWQGQAQMHNFIEAPIVAGAGRVHPTQKPVSILKKWIRISSNPGDIVLDPFAGSGSTGIAALELERDFVLIEKEKQYVDIIHERLIQATDFDLSTDTTEPIPQQEGQ